ncbi:hypothetical protein [Spirosoma utsteinense]|uniref:hypothetical protein n=1 Tax=Spirosoma utsteinense TaxID=2585773 RepID=UPI0016497489|nr:hypothetical protein [Spirosoma utsteinense]
MSFSVTTHTQLRRNGPAGVDLSGRRSNCCVAVTATQPDNSLLIFTYGGLFRSGLLPNQRINFMQVDSRSRTCVFLLLYPLSYPTEAGEGIEPPTDRLETEPSRTNSIAYTSGDDTTGLSGNPRQGWQ